MSEYNEYPYESLEGTGAHVYLLPSILSLLDKSKNKTILDIGCGNGWIAHHLIKRGYNVYGIDASKSGIALAKMQHPTRFFIQDLSKDTIPNELNEIPFDTIISTEVIEHIYSPVHYFEYCKNIFLKNGFGEMIISTPYHGYLKNVILAITGKLDSHFTVLWEGGHIKFWSKKTLTKALNQAGFTVTRFKGSGRTAFLWKSMIMKAVIDFKNLT